MGKVYTIPKEDVIRANLGWSKSMIGISLLLASIFTGTVGYLAYLIYTEGKGQTYLGSLFVVLMCSIPLYKTWILPFEQIKKRKTIVRNVGDRLLLSNCLIEAGIADHTIKMKIGE